MSAYQIADSTMVLYAGHVVESGPTEDVTLRPRHPYTQVLIRSIPSPRSQPNTVPPSVANVISASHSQTVPATGCVFAPRCPMVQDVCRTTTPALRAAGPTHAVACHLAEIP